MAAGHKVFPKSYIQILYNYRKIFEVKFPKAHTQQLEQKQF